MGGVAFVEDAKNVLEPPIGSIHNSFTDDSIFFAFPT